MGWNLKQYFFFGIFVYNFVSTCSYVICVLNLNVSDDILYLVISIFKIAKQKMAA